DLHASCFFQLQRPKLVLAHVPHIDSEIPSSRLAMRLTHSRCIHLLPRPCRHLGRIENLSSVQNSYARHQHHELNRLAVFHLRNLYQPFSHTRPTSGPRSPHLTEYQQHSAARCTMPSGYKDSHPASRPFAAPAARSNPTARARAVRSPYAARPHPDRGPLPPAPRRAHAGPVPRRASDHPAPSSALRHPRRIAVTPSTHGEPSRPQSSPGTRAHPCTHPSAAKPHSSARLTPPQP